MHFLLHQFPSSNKLNHFSNKRNILCILFLILFRFSLVVVGNRKNSLWFLIASLLKFKAPYILPSFWKKIAGISQKILVVWFFWSSVSKCGSIRFLFSWETGERSLYRNELVTCKAAFSFFYWDKTYLLFHYITSIRRFMKCRFVRLSSGSNSAPVFQTGVGVYPFLFPV